MALLKTCILSLAFLIVSPTLAHSFEFLTQNALDALNKEQLSDYYHQVGQAAKQGDPKAQLVVGARAKSDGELVRGAKWIIKSANQGYAMAQLIAGTCYLNGEGVLQDYDEANRWFDLAASQGNYHAFAFLARMYTLGEGVPKDDVHAYALALIAATNGIELGIAVRDKIAPKLSPYLKEEALRRAKKLMNKMQLN